MKTKMKSQLEFSLDKESYITYINITDYEKGIYSNVRGGDMNDKQKIKKNRATIYASLIISVIFFSKISFSEENRNFNKKLNISLTGGYCSMNIGDINTYLEAFDNYLIETTSYEGGKINTLHYFPEMDLELRLDLSSRFAVGVRIGIISEENETSFEYTKISPPYTYYQSYSIEQKTRVLPLILICHYYALSNSRIHLFINFGLAYYFSKCSLIIHESLPTMPPPVTYSIITNEPGLAGGLGLEYNLLKFVAFVIEAHGRYSKARNLKGISSGIGGAQEGTLYIGEKYYAADDRYRPYLITSPSKPSGEEFRNMREAFLDLSGFSIKVGIRIKII